MPLNLKGNEGEHRHMNDGKVSSELDLVETEKPSSDRCRFFRIVWKQIVQSMVNEREAPISRLKVRRDIIDFSGS